MDTVIIYLGCIGRAIGQKTPMGYSLLRNDGKLENVFCHDDNKIPGILSKRGTICEIKTFSSFTQASRHIEKYGIAL